MSGVSGAFFPFWSPDSRFIAFWTPEGLKKVSVEGGAAISITKSQPFGGTWNRNGVILIGSSPGPLLQVAENGGDVKPVLTLDKARGETSQIWPQFLPDGRKFLYLSRANTKNAVYLGSLGSSERRKVLDVESQAIYARGHLLFIKGESLMAQPFDVSSGQLTGDSFRVADKVGTTTQGLSGSCCRHRIPAFWRSGTVSKRPR